MTKVYQLVTKEGGISYSPFVIYTELFLKHKGIDYTAVPLTFLDVSPTIKKLTNDKWDKVPTLEFDNGEHIFDSFPICEYLDKNYPDNPIRSNSNSEATVFEFLKSLGQYTFKLIILDIERNMDTRNSSHLRKSKEELYGMSLEEFSGNAEDNIQKIYTCTELLVPILRSSPFFEGKSAGFCDYLVAGKFQPLRNINPNLYHKLIHQNPNKEISKWALKLDELYDGFLKV